MKGRINGSVEMGKEKMELVIERNDVQVREGQRMSSDLLNPIVVFPI